MRGKRVIGVGLACACLTLTGCTRDATPKAAATKAGPSATDLADRPDPSAPTTGPDTAADFQAGPQPTVVGQRLTNTVRYDSTTTLTPSTDAPTVSAVSALEIARDLHFADITSRAPADLTFYATVNTASAANASPAGRSVWVFLWHGVQESDGTSINDQRGNETHDIVLLVDDESRRVFSALSVPGPTR